MKKVCSLMLALLMVFGMMTVASAAAAKVSGFSDNGVSDLSKKLDNIVWDCNPGNTNVIKDISYNVFKYSNLGNSADFLAYIEANGKDETARNALAKKILQGVKFRVRSRSGAKVIDEVSITNVKYTAEKAEIPAVLDTDGTTVITPAVPAVPASYTFDIKITTIDPFVSVNDVDYNVDIYFEIDGRTDNAYYFNISGNFTNHVTEVNSDSIEADSWAGQVIEATEYVGKITLVGNEDTDVYAHVKMQKGKKIYFVAAIDSNSADEAVFNKYPSIDWAYKVTQVGLNGYNGNFIELAGVDNTYYVYGKNADGALKFLGRGGELLPLSAKYYVSTMKLDIEEETVEGDLPVAEETVPEGNFNPSTGI